MTSSSTLAAFQQNRLSNGNHPDTALDERLPCNGLGAAQPRRFGDEITIGQLRQIFTRAEDVHLAFDVAVERRELIVAKRPILLDPVKRPFSEIVRCSA